jgi:hypothetical protein
MPVTFNPFSGPLGSPFDAKTYPSNVYCPNPSTGKILNVEDHSTGGLSTGIGFAINDSGDAVNGALGISAPLLSNTAPGNRNANNFTDDYIPGVTMPGSVVGMVTTGSPPPNPAYPFLATDARLTCIGGGKDVVTPGPSSSALPDYAIGKSSPLPYVAQPLLAMGNGGSRDAGAANPRTGFGMKLVTAAAAVAQGAVIETGFVNRTTWAASGLSLASGANAFGSSTTASPAVT